MNKLALLTLITAMLALGACRRETPYEPLKLGGPAATNQVQR